MAFIVLRFQERLEQRRFIFFALTVTELVFCHQIRSYVIDLTLPYVLIQGVFHRISVVATGKELTEKLSEESRDTNIDLDALFSDKKYLLNITHFNHKWVGFHQAEWRSGSVLGP